jgi:hypothetical protein
MIIAEVLACLSIINISVFYYNEKCAAFKNERNVGRSQKVHIKNTVYKPVGG